MDFVEWCDFILTTCIEIMKTSPKARTIGVDAYELTQALSASLRIPNFSRQEEYHKSTYDALQNLKAIGFMENNERSKSHWKVSRVGLQHAIDQTPQWFAICQEKIDEEHRQLLSLINRLSPHTVSGHVWLEIIEHQKIASELGWPNHQIWNVAQELREWEYISGFLSAANTVKLQASYKGLVWETRRGVTLESKFIDGLVKDWETTNVEFKQYLYIKTVEQKAEFIKDVLSLVNTKASGHRWMIIGFHNKTHDYFGPPNPDLNLDDFERLIGEYTNPYVEVRYEVVEYRKGHVGKLEVLRDPKKLPYRVAKSLGDKLKGDKKQIFKGQTFVRHGSQAVVARGTELKELVDEGKQARLNP